MSAPLIVEQGLPEWVARFAERIQALVRDRPDGPTRLYRVADTAHLPDATKWPGAILYHTALGVPCVSNGTFWYPITVGAHL